MSLITRLLRRFSRKHPTTPPPPPELRPSVEQLAAQAPAPPEPQPLALRPSPSREPSPEPAPLVENVPDEAQDDEHEDPADPGEEEGDDPFIGSGEPLQISLPTADSVAAARRRAEQLALSGPQRVTLVDPAGPGSLAETLARLEAEGRVASEVVDDPETGPFMLYRPVS